MIQTIAEHTIDTSYLTGGIVIDAGCRGFEFSKEMKRLGEKVMAYDLEDFTDVPEGIEYTKAAILSRNESVKVVKMADKNATHISRVMQGEKVDGLSLQLIFDLLGDNVDVCKLDVEGSEYEILADPKLKPVPKMWTIEFHEHCQPMLQNQFFDQCVENLLKNYEAIKLIRYPAHGLGMNYWDTLWIRKDIYVKH